MDLLKRLPAWWIAPLLWVATVAAANAADDVRLVNAAQQGDHTAVRSLLQARVDVNSRQPDGATALAWASNRNDQQMAEVLISAGANVNAANDYGVTPLALACLNGSTAMVEKLLKARANPDSSLLTGETALMTCARTGNVDAVKALIARGANVNAKEARYGQTALMWAVEQKHLAAARALIEHGADVRARSEGGFTPLLFAAQQGDLELVKTLLAAGADVNEATPPPTYVEAFDTYNLRTRRTLARPTAPPGGTTALLMAAASGHEAVGLFLLEHGANPNAADVNGTTALHYAPLKGMVMLVRDTQAVKIGDVVPRENMIELTQALLARGANPNARLNRNTARNLTFSIAGATPFFVATQSVDVPLMRLLLAHGADPLIPTTEGTTTLMLAAGLGARTDRTPEEVKDGLEAARLLVDLRADVNAVGEYKWTALHGTAYSGSESIAEFLLEKGAAIDARDLWDESPLAIAQGFTSVLLDDFNKKTQGPHPNVEAVLLKWGAPQWVPPVRPDPTAAIPTDPATTPGEASHSK
jgi:ankyrin repeat protein